MFDHDDLIKSALIEPDRIWFSLDSFWRSQTTQSTMSLVQFQTYTYLLLELNIHSRSNYFRSFQDVPHSQPWLNLPWYPFVLFRDQMDNLSYVLYGEPFDYSPVPELFYGQTSAGRYVYPMPFEIVSITSLSNEITEPTTLFDPARFAFDQATGTLSFDVNPFSVMSPKVDPVSGREYIVLWARNLLIDLEAPFDWSGWVLGFENVYRLSYSDGVKAMWELALLGPSIGRYERGLMSVMGFPYALSDSQVVSVENNSGWQWVISTDDRIYTSLVAQTTPVVTGGDEVVFGQPLTDGIQFFEFSETLSTTADQLPGLVLKIPLSTGIVAELSFANIATAWTFVPGRPSEWRFPVGGEPALVEQFWIDVDTYAVANSIDFATLYGLPAAVNPMQRVIQDLLQNTIFVASVDLASVPRAPGAFADRAREFLPQDILLVLQQSLGSVADSYDLGTETSETVYYGYNADVPTEVISVSGTDLVYFDYTPLVVTY